MPYTLIEIRKDQEPKLTSHATKQAAISEVITREKGGDAASWKIRGRLTMPGSYYRPDGKDLEYRIGYTSEPQPSYPADTSRVLMLVNMLSDMSAKIDSLSRRCDALRASVKDKEVTIENLTRGGDGG